MNCNECISIMEEFVEGDLDPKASERAAAHVAVCNVCQNIHQELQGERKVYSRYLLKIEERPGSWNAVLTQIREAKSAERDSGTVSIGFLERLFATVLHRPLIVAMAAVVLLMGVGLGFLYRPYLPTGEPLRGAGPFTVSENEAAYDETKNDIAISNPRVEPDIGSPVKYGPRPAEKNRAAMVNQKKKQPTSAVRTFDKADQAAVSFDTSEAAFNKHIDNCEMVLRSFRNVVTERDGSSVDISYERRISKKLLTETVRFRRAAESQGNLPVEQLLVSLEILLRDITRLGKKTSFPDADLVKRRIQESGIIAKLQFHTSIARISE